MLQEPAETTSQPALCSLASRAMVDSCLVTKTLQMTLIYFHSARMGLVQSLRHLAYHQANPRRSPFTRLMVVPPSVFPHIKT
jgi:hypothetical protein